VALSDLPGPAGEDPVARRLVAEGLAVVEEDRFRLTPEGLAVADAVARELSEA
jgi:hypothetical protein